MNWYQILALLTCAPFALMHVLHIISIIVWKRGKYDLGDAVIGFIAVTLLLVAFLGVR